MGGIIGLRLGCSPLYQQSLMGIIQGGAVTPIEDSSYKGEHPQSKVFHRLKGFRVRQVTWGFFKWQMRLGATLPCPFVDPQKQPVVCFSLAALCRHYTPPPPSRPR